MAGDEAESLAARLSLLPEDGPLRRLPLPPELPGPLHAPAPWKPGPTFYLQAPISLTMVGLGTWQLAQGQSPALLVLGLAAVAMVAYRARLGREGPPGVQALRLRPEGLEVHDAIDGVNLLPYLKLVRLKRLHRRGGLEYHLAFEGGGGLLVSGELSEADAFEEGLSRATGLDWEAGDSP